MKYISNGFKDSVVGNHEKGAPLDLDPQDKNTQRLIRLGAIEKKASAKKSSASEAASDSND